MGVRAAVGWVIFAIVLPSMALAEFYPIIPSHHLLVPAKDPQANQEAIPDSAAQQHALELIQNVFKNDYNDPTPRGRAVLAGNLLHQGIKTNDDPAGKFTLLLQATDAAIAGGDPATLSKAIDALGKNFAVDAVAMKTKGYETIAWACWSPVQAEQLADGCELAIDQALAADEYDEAVKLQSIGQGAANHADDLDLVQRFDLLRPELSEIRQQYLRSKSALDALQSNPNDAAACATAGKFLCFVKSDWTAGLPVLAHADDRSLSNAAKADLGAGNDAAATARAADDWWEISQKLPVLEKQHAQARAIELYRKVFPGLDGLSKSVASQRLADFDAAEIVRLHLAPGLASELFEDKDFLQLNMTRVDREVDFEWGHQAPDPAMPKEDYSIRFTGKLRIRHPGLYTLAIQANEGAKLFLDGKTVLETATGTHRRTVQKMDLKLDAGMHDLRLDYWEGSGQAKCKLLWIAPGSLALVPIPAEAFYHEAYKGQ